MLLFLFELLVSNFLQLFFFMERQLSVRKNETNDIKPIHSHDISQFTDPYDKLQTHRTN